jgi:hypothetical protein
MRESIEQRHIHQRIFPKSYLPCSLLWLLMDPAQSGPSAMPKPCRSPSWASRPFFFQVMEVRELLGMHVAPPTVYWRSREPAAPAETAVANFVGQLRVSANVFCDPSRRWAGARAPRWFVTRTLRGV